MLTSHINYNLTWFKKRAHDTLVKIGEGVRDYSDSLLLYSPQGQAAYESAQGEQLPYFELVTKPEHEHLKAIAPAVSAVLPETCTYIDLGPGTEHKAAYFFTAFKKRGLSFVYTPVDVSDYFLRLSTEYAMKHGVAVEPLQISFEELGVVWVRHRHRGLLPCSASPWGTTGQR